MDVGHDFLLMVGFATIIDDKGGSNKTQGQVTSCKSQVYARPSHSTSVGCIRWVEPVETKTSGSLIICVVGNARGCVGRAPHVQHTPRFPYYPQNLSKNQNLLKFGPNLSKLVSIKLE
jgi:hypothetical protein